MKNHRKSTPNRVKIETKSVKRLREPLQDDLGGARGAIFGYYVSMGHRLGPQNSIKIITNKKTN